MAGSKGSSNGLNKGSSEMLRNYKELKVWQKSYQLCLEIYKITNKFPQEERYGLTSQVRRSAVSIPSNIAEGYGRRTTPDYVRSLYIAYGSNCELGTQIDLSCDLGYVNIIEGKKLKDSIQEIERMLIALIRSLKNKAYARGTLTLPDPRPLDPSAP